MTLDELEEALKYDERMWRAFQLLKPVHRDGLLAAVEAVAGSTQLRTELAEAHEALTAARAEIERLRVVINTPQILEFMEAVRLEAVHQRERWSAEHDAGKTDADWFWLIGYLAGKAIRPDTTPEKKLHHIIATAAACLNWHAHATGTDTRMRPGIEPPTEAERG